MTINGSLNTLGLSADITLCHGGGGVLFFMFTQTIPWHRPDDQKRQPNIAISDLVQKETAPTISMRGDSEAVFFIDLMGIFLEF